MFLFQNTVRVFCQQASVRPTTSQRLPALVDCFLSISLLISVVSTTELYLKKEGSKAWPTPTDPAPGIAKKHELPNNFDSFVDLLIRSPCDNVVSKQPNCINPS